MLEYLCDEGPDYVPLVASNLGLVLGYAERRCETLVERGCIEPVSQEVVYRVTERGERQLEAFRETRGVASALTADDESVTSAD
jgi:predicted transcriptional regulator